jgi:hypothetical protein
MLVEWALSKLEPHAARSAILLRDPLHLLPAEAGAIHRFGTEHGYTVIVAATNLAFRDLYERAVADPETKKLLIIDRAPLRRVKSLSLAKAPPPFYPDFLARTPPPVRIDLDLRELLKATTGDPDWPLEVNDPRFARLVVRSLSGVLRAHQNLRVAHDKRFTDHDFKTIVAFAALGIPDVAFKMLGPEDLWRIGLLGHEALEELESLTPEVTRPIRDALHDAPAPFCWLESHEPNTVIRAFYLALLLSQHLESWPLLLANIDPALSPYSGIEPAVLAEAGPKLVALDPDQARRDLEELERSLDAGALKLVLLDQAKAADPANALAVIERESYSILFRSLALLLALDDLLASSSSAVRSEHVRLAEVLTSEAAVPARFVDRRPSLPWSHLKEAYRLAFEVQGLREELRKAAQTIGVLKPAQLSFAAFRELWNDRRLNRLEYFVSALGRLVESGDLLPRPAEGLPSAFENALRRVQQSVRELAEDVFQKLEALNLRFQDLVVLQYPGWLEQDSEVRLTSQFLRRCLKPYWDPAHEKAVVLVFDGMRYDIWDELLRPLLADRMEVLADLPASALLPSETHVSRWALAAGTEAAGFWPPRAESLHLKAGLQQVFGYTGEVEAIAPEGAGTGETVRYRAGNLEWFIFEFCDKELHGMQMRTLPDGRRVPSRPLAFIYQQHLKNLVELEVMAIVRKLAPGTKVFVTADHGFGPVGRQPLFFPETALNERSDCSYLSCLLRVPADSADLPAKLRRNVLSFTPEQLRHPADESRTEQKSGSTFHKQYRAIAFPRSGYSFSRQGSHYNPDAYTHGGISIQELMIPMVALRVREREEGPIRLASIEGAADVVEGDELELRMRIERMAPAGPEEPELRVEVEAAYAGAAERVALPPQVVYVSGPAAEVVYRFRPEAGAATDEERRAGVMRRTLTITAVCRHGRGAVRKVAARSFSVRLSSERIVRRIPTHLGNILGLTPKSMR